jgi:ribA/ribD-fused uncharacterized protein
MQTTLVNRRGSIGFVSDQPPPSSSSSASAAAPSAQCEKAQPIAPQSTGTCAHRYFYGRIERPAHAAPGQRTEPALFFLSNFSASAFTLGNKRYATVEHYYQSQKFRAHTALAERVRTAVNARAAKLIATANSGLVRADWATARVGVMRTALAAKFEQNPALRTQLLATAPAALHEDAPHDPVWGASGQDLLGKLLGELRDAVRDTHDLEDTDFWTSK